MRPLDDIDARRHSYAAVMIAAGVNAKSLSTFMGHANIGITLDRYGHLMPGSEEEAAGLVSQRIQRFITANPVETNRGKIQAQVEVSLATNRQDLFTDFENMLDCALEPLLPMRHIGNVVAAGHSNLK